MIYLQDLCPKLCALGGVIMEINILQGGCVASRFLPGGKTLKYFLRKMCGADV